MQTIKDERGPCLCGPAGIGVRGAHPDPACPWAPQPALPPAPLMHQNAPYPAELADLVAGLEHRPGWRFDLADMARGQGSGGLTLTIRISCADSYDHARQIVVAHYFPVPPAAFLRSSWQRWLLDQCLLVDRHEACEYFTIYGRKPYAPHHGPGEDPYIVWEHGTAEQVRTSFRGVIDDDGSGRSGAPPADTRIRVAEGWLAAHPDTPDAAELAAILAGQPNGHAGEIDGPAREFAP